MVAFLGFKTFLPEKLFPELAQSDSDHIVVDEMMQEAMAGEDSLSVEDKNIYEKDSINNGKELEQAQEEVEEEEPVIPNQLLGQEDIKPDQSYFLDHFYQKLSDLEGNPEKTKARIAYFSDSMTDGDLIVQDVRQFFQDKFGGKGVGFVPITSESARSRISVIHRFSPNWKSFSFMKSHKDTIPPFGIHGDVFYAIDSLRPNYVRISSGQNPKNRPLPQPTLYYGQSTSDSAAVEVIANADTTSYRLAPRQLVNTLKLSDASLSSLQLNFRHADSVPLYGIDMNSSFGIQVDNFSNRGNSGLPLAQLNTNLMRAFKQKGIQYDLIILHYGTNVMGAGSASYGWYGRSMGRVVKHLRQAFPETSILVISVGDRSQKYNNEMKTDSAVAPLLNAQKAYATAEKTGFINLYELMGGKNSMVDWVEGDPPRANKDYTHFNPRGAKEIAGLIFGELYQGFEKYKEKLKKQEEKLRKEQERIQDSIKQDSIKKAYEIREQEIQDTLQSDDS